MLPPGEGMQVFVSGKESLEMKIRSKLWVPVSSLILFYLTSVR